jgi:hypothetical protein
VALGLAALGSTWAGAAAQAAYVSSDIRTPSPRYVSTNQIQLGPAQIHSFFDVFTDLQRVPLPPPGASQVNSFFDVFTEITFDAGGGPTVVQVPAAVTIRTTSGGAPGDPFDTEMLQMDLVGVGPIAGVRVRESPTRASLGRTQIDDLGGGLYRIDSFFDIFTEISLDGGQNWTEASGPLRLQGVPEPSTVVLASLAGLGIGLGVWRRKRASM